MPPKQTAASKAAAEKTFGLKNKNKSKKVQQFVERTQQAAQRAGKTPAMLKAEALAKSEREAKKAAKKEVPEIAVLLAPVIQKTVVPLGADPKSVLCSYFKAGACRNGAKCKFSHDMEVERKKDKINIYVDPREADTMDTWDQAKLEDVVKAKDKERPNATKIVCKYFIEAIETKKYGWFWQCPTGEDCIYQHKLPPGFVLKSEMKKDDDEEKPTIEWQIEEERKLLDRTKCTMVTPETFRIWKEKKKAEKEAALIATAKEANKKSSGRGNGLSGRALFAYDPALFVDDADAAGDDAYEIDSNYEEGEEKTLAKDNDAAEEQESGEEGDEEEEQEVQVHVTAVDESLFLEDADLPSEED